MIKSAMKNVISASRRTDLVAYFPGWLSEALQAGSATVFGPSGRTYRVDLDPDKVHTLVLWSKNFANLIENAEGLREQVRRFDQIYLHFTITGLGGSRFEPAAPPPETALAQLPELVGLAGTPERISVRFDPVVYWEEDGKRRSNLKFLEELAPRLESLGLRTVRFSIMQWYPKVRRRWARHRLACLEPKEADKIRDVEYLSRTAADHGVSLWACSQRWSETVSGIRPSACIDGHRLMELHPFGEPAPESKDRSQRAECLCTKSVDIGSYTQVCPHGCLYCYASPESG